METCLCILPVLCPVIRLVIFEASLRSWELQCNYNWSWRCPIIFIMMGNVLKGFDVRFSQETKPEWQWMFYPTIIWQFILLFSPNSKRKEKPRKLIHILHIFYFLQTLLRLERKQKAKFERKSWKQNNAAVNLELSQEFQSSQLAEIVERRGGWGSNQLHI